MGPAEVLVLLVAGAFVWLFVKFVLLAVHGRRKKCQQCAEPVRKNALVCRHCGHTFR